MVELLKPVRGGFLRPFGCGWFIPEFLLGHGPEGAPKIDSEKGSYQADLFHHYKLALMRATALDRATRTEEKKARREKRPINPDNIEKLAERYLARMSYKAQGARFHSFVVYFLPFRDCAGWKQQVGRNAQSSKSITQKVNPVSTSVLLQLTKPLLTLSGQTLFLLYTDNHPVKHEPMALF